MGLRDLFRKYRKRHDTSPCPSDTNSAKIEQATPPPPQQQQQKQNKTSLTCIDMNTTA
jgi:hypothetical protein